VLILGQDPYPGEGVADGLAFSSAREKVPASLRNIFIEYSSDLGLPAPMSPDLSKWSERGVLLLNRTLTTTVGERNAHVSIGWRNFTYSVAEFLAQRDVIAILWGNGARELADLFDKKIESVHPSPLSARRGFFGSEPFSRANELLESAGREPIDWQI
jgi:uracil-DNA glycosylase